MSLSCAQPPSPLSKSQAECIQISPHNCIPHLGLQASQRSSLSLDDSPRYTKLTFDISAFESSQGQNFTRNGGLISLANYSKKRQILKGLWRFCVENHISKQHKSFFLSQLKKCSTQVAGKKVYPGLDRRYNMTLVQRVPNKDTHRVERGREERGRRNKSSDVLSG